VRTAFVRALVAEADRDERVVLLTGDLGFMALEPFRDRFPDRFFNMGVAEQNMIGVATGLAESGYTPFCYSIVPFAVLRPYEFIRDGPVLHGLKVRIVGMGGGFEYGTAGPTHYGIEDVGVMRLLQDMAVIAPADAAQTAAALPALNQWPGPAYLRLGKNDRLIVPGLDGRFELGRVQRVRDGSDLVLFAMGGIAASVVEAADRLQADGISAAVVVISSINPRPVEDIVALTSSYALAVTVEAHVISGGIGSLVAEIIADNAVHCSLLRLGVERPYGERGGSEEYLHGIHGLAPDAVAARVRAALESGVAH
jgi:transketolase